MAKPEALQWSVEGCVIQAALELVGDRWTLVVLREVFTGVRRFDDLTVRTAIPRQVLTDRLRRLVDAEVLRREPYREPGQRERAEYRLTDKGLELYPVLLALQSWGERHLAGPEGPPTSFRHRGCGAAVGLAVRCEDGHEVERVRDVVVAPGPGARRRTA